MRGGTGGAVHEDGGVTNFKRQVLSVHQSPMNSRRWCLSLACGHEAWVTRLKRPTAKFVPCEGCKKESEAR